MKTIFRLFGTAALTVGLAAGALAQDPAPAATPAPAAGPCENNEARAATENKFREIYATKLEEAVALAKEYNKTYAACTQEDIKAFVTYLNGYIGPTEAKLKKIADDAERKADFAKYNNGIKTSNWDDAYAAGKKIIEKWTPDNLEVILPLGSIALDEVAKKPANNKYNDDTLRFANMAIQKINEGKPSKTYGIFQFEYKNKDNALGWMNYTIGYVTYYGKGDKKTGLQSLYKATQIASEPQKFPQLYGAIGDFYFDEVKRLGEEIRVKTVAAGNKDTDETKALIAQLKAYAERSIDAYGRAQKLIPTTDTARKAYRDGLTAQIELVYNLRFQKKDGMDAFVAKQIANPLPDPSTVPTPIVEVDPAEVPATTGTTPATTTPATGTKPATAPANTTGTKPATTTPAPTKKPVSTTGTGAKGTTPAAAAKKPVVTKKKGTR